MSLRDYLQSFERRNSDSNLIILNQKHLSSSSPLAIDNYVDNKMNLFDEIKKLTNHLFKLTSQDQQQQRQQHEIDDNANTQIMATEHVLMDENINVTDVIDIDDTLIEQSLQPNDIKVVENGNNSNLVVENDDNKIKHLTVDENNNNTGDNESKEIVVNVQKSGVRGLLKKFMILADCPQHLSPPINESLNAPWPISTKRTKFRINQMSSRDVPIYPTGKLSKLTKQNAFDTTETSEKHVTTTTTTTFRKSFDNNNIEASTQMTKTIVQNNSSPTTPQLSTHFDMSSARKQHLLQLLDEIDQELKDLPSSKVNNKANNLFQVTPTNVSTSLFDNASQLKANHEAFLRNHRIMPTTTGSVSFDFANLNDNNHVVSDDESTVKAMRSFFQSRPTTGSSVKQIQAQMEAKNK